jgi:carbon storage regulator
MLVLSRFPGEAIIIDGKTTVEILKVQGDKVRIGIVAPRDIRVDRKEIHEKRLEANVQPQAPEEEER